MKESITLYNQAVELGLCEDWQKKWDGDNIGSLCNMFKEGIHFCIEKNYPDIDFMVRKFRGKTEQYGVYISEMFSIYAEHLVYVMNGDCMGKIVNNGFTVTKIYVRHNSVLNISARDNSITYIDMHNDTELNLSISDKAKVIVNKYGGVIKGDIDKARVKLHTERN